MNYFLSLCCFLLATLPLFPSTSTWNGSISSDINVDGNWTPSRPSGTDEALFQQSTSSNNTPTLTGGSFSVYDLLINEPESSFTFTADGGTFSVLSGVNSTNPPTGTQIFSSINGGSFTFQGQSSAGYIDTLKVKYLIGTTSDGSILFQDSSSAGYGEFFIGTTLGTALGSFSGTSSALHASITVGDDQTYTGKVGHLVFENSSTAKNAVIFVGDIYGESTVTFKDNSSLELGSLSIRAQNNSGSVRGTATFMGSSLAGGISSDERCYITVGDIQGTTNSSGALIFRENASAHFANIFVADHGKQSSVDFYDTSTAGNAVLFAGTSISFDKHVAGTITFHDNATAGSAEMTVRNPEGNSYLYFEDDSTASDSLIILGSAGNYSGALAFNKNSTGSASAGNATITAFTNSSIHFYEGSSSNTADITLLDSSNLTFDGAQTYTLRGLNTAKDSSISLNSSNLLLNYEETTAAVIAGVISGSGSLVKAGIGTVILSGNNTYTGATTVLQGGLRLTGSLAGDLFVQGGAIVSSALVAGAYEQSNSTFLAELFEAEQAGLHIEKTATLSNTNLVFSLGGSFSVNYTYTLLTADEGLTGVFNSLNTSELTGVNTNLVTPIVSYDANSAFFTLKTHFNKAATSANSLAIANILDTPLTTPSETKESVLRVLIQETTEEASNSLNTLTGEQYTNFLFTATQVNKYFIQSIYDPIRHLVSTKEEFSSCRKDVGVWSLVSGGHSVLKDKKTITGVGMNRVEISAGAHKTFFHEWTLGIASSFAYDKLSYGMGAYGRNRSLLGGLYSLYRPDRFYILLNGIGGYSGNSFRRYISINNVKAKQKSHPYSSQFAIYGESGMDFHTRNSLIQPFIGMEGEHIHQNAIEEKPFSSLALNFSKKIQNILTSRLGVHITGASDECILFGMDLAWNYRLTKNRSFLDAYFISFAESFEVKGIYLTRSRFEGSIFVTAPVSPNFRIFSKLSGELASGENSYGLMGGVEASW